VEGLNPVAKSSRAPNWQQALIVLTGTVVATVAVLTLSWARVVLIPVALAIYLTFLLTPLTRRIEVRGVGRIPSVILVVILAAGLFAGMGWVVTRQVSGLIEELPSYTANIKEKVRTLRTLGAGRSTERLERMVEEISGELSAPLKARSGLAVPKAAKEDVAAMATKPLAVNSNSMVGVPAAISDSPQMGSLLQILGSIALAFVLALFMLLSREDLRNRFIRLMGKGHVTLTTRVVDEAGQRISRYLVVQALINGGYGLILAIALLVLGVDYALLWGFLAAVLRYIPYLGAWLAAIFPLTMAVAEFNNWWPVLALVGIFIVLELVTNNVIEPWLYGKTMGVSSVALIVAAAFFALLWGPIGMVLSAPLTVCLVVLGKYVPQLAFLDILLGDDPALAADVSYYQRLLARDQDEATDVVLAKLKTTSVEDIYDELLIPALSTMKRDRERDDLLPADEEFVLRATAEIMEDIGEIHTAEKPDATTENAERLAPPIHIFGCPAHDQADRLGLEMFAQLLDARRWNLEILSTNLLVSELVDAIVRERPALVCIGAVPPGGLAHTRYLCKRLRASLPDLTILVGRWGMKAETRQRQYQPLRDAGADSVSTTLQEMHNQLDGWYPVCTHQAAGRTVRVDAPMPAETAPALRPQTPAAAIASSQ
jgi:predicted PurR-regulated permease PerM